MNIIQDLMKQKGGKQGYINLYGKLRDMQPLIVKQVEQIKQMVVNNNYINSKTN